MKKTAIIPLAFVTMFIVMSIAPFASATFVASNDLYVGRNLVKVGYVNTWNDQTNLYITYHLSVAYATFVETHVAIGTYIVSSNGIATPVGIPVTNKGNPKVGNFPYAHESLNSAVDSYTIPLSVLGLESGDKISIAAHAVIMFQDGTVQTGWTDCSSPDSEPKGEFTGNNWAVFYCHTIE